MIATAWRVAGVGFSLLVILSAILLAGADPQVTSFPGTGAGDAFWTYDLRTDDLTVLLLAVVGVVSACVQVYSIGYLHERAASYTALVTLFTAAMVTVVVSDSLFLLLIGWEVMGACSYLLISHYWERRDARSGAVKAFLITRLADVAFLFGIFVLGLGYGTFRISELGSSPISPAALTTGTVLLLVGVVGKSAQVPLQTWLPDAMPGPSPVSALIHAATMVAAGVFLIARLYDVFVAAGTTLTVLAVIACVTMLFAALCAMAAVEVKRVLAWSTVSQLAIMFAGLSLGTADGRHAALFHLVTHAAFKGLLFLCAGVLLHQVGSAAFVVLRRHTRLGASRKAMPVTFGTMTIGLAALAGVPGFAGFFSKDAVVEAAWHQARDGSAVGWVVLVSVCLTAALTAFYCVRLWLWVFFRTPALAGAVDAFEDDAPMADVDDPATAKLRDAPWVMLAPLILLALGAIVLGYADGLHLNWVVAALTTVLAALGALPAYSLWRRGADPRPAVVEREFGVDAAYGKAVVVPVRWFAKLAVLGDRDVIGTYVRAAGRTGTLASQGFRLLQTGNVQTYLTFAVAGVVALAILAGVIGA
ncbi:proton-translocating NADH-quinone oxidoreductase, chain L [Kribbella flavida DSM 17836]|uniref:Proton-translocating NADH-quinone oxidoreductase, chain L n=1 Tax=Kribbella flavida (strain DSM 17836 / JCM 10339 / NBRC 14399) TaxID=479435 RepID=D2PVJ2_KRIFD|nr:proton-conducting transporter membrane subunit [Kribbella flavida]ADB35232.1 proton-translocating NADH-quinone oxidoreductase, chain L [Kribbella flavida DSM 17836]